MDGVPGAIEVTQQAGDVLIFVDSVVCAHPLTSALWAGDHTGLAAVAEWCDAGVQARLDGPADPGGAAQHPD